jgi:hypothetical protein
MALSSHHIAFKWAMLITDTNRNDYHLYRQAFFTSFGLLM